MSSKFGKSFAQICIWVGLVFVFSTAFNYHEKWKINKIEQNFVSRYGNKNNDKEKIVLRKSNDGHFYIPAHFTNKKTYFLSRKLNEIELLIDSGASKTMLSLEDARKIGININKLKFDDKYYTANGVIYAANFTMPYMKIGNFIMRDIPVSVTKSDMNVSLLGMSTLKHFDVTFSDQYLIITYAD